MMNKTLLLVEDESILALTQSRALEKYGYIVITASSGKEAIDLVNSVPEIQLVLMDIDLGEGMDGTSAAEIILKNHQIPIVFLSSHTEPEIVAKTEKITSYGYVVKNSVITVLDASIKMAFKLFDAHRTILNTSQLLESTGKLAKVGGWQVDLNTMKLSWTLQTFEIAGIDPPNEPPLEEGIRLFAPEARPLIEQALDLAIKEGKPYDLELPIITARGRHAWVQTQGFAEIRHGKTVRLFGTFQDITQRKLSDLAYRESAFNVETLLNSNTDLMWSLKPDYSLIIANSVFLEGFHKTTGVLLKSGDSLLMEGLFPEEYLSYWKGFYDKALTGQEIETEIEIPTEDPDVKQLFHMSFKPILGETGIEGACCYGRNITERRLFEQKINTLLHEKELILKEVHHRIKNNMTMMSALLNLQANTDINQIAKEALLDASRRIQSMTILYDKLYKSQDFRKISFELYLKQLIEDLISNFFNQKNVQIQMNIQDFELEAKNMQTLGIIMNELITNIMKYAFQDMNRGLITITTTKQKEVIALEVKDNGSGIPEVEMEGKGKGFGLLLVRELSSQLRGKLSFHVDHGTCVRLEFPL